MTKPVVVKQDEQQPVPTEVLAESIVAIAAGMKKIRAGRLGERALVVLLKDSTGVAQYEIKKVLDGLESLEATYLKKKPSPSR